MSVRTDVINLTVNVNGNASQNQLNELRKRAADLKFELQGLKKGTQDYLDKAKELKSVTDQMTALKQQIGITALTQKELTQELTRLKSLRGSVTPFSDEYKNLSVQIKAVETRLYNVRNGVQGFTSFFSKIKDEVKQFGTIAAAYLGFQFLTTQFTNIIRGAGKLSDQLADIRRVTGLTADEAKNLNTQLKALDTRTSTQGLRDIAIIAGKLGVEGVDNIVSFTKAVDKLVVALGDELGNADEITTQLGKILNVFEGKITGDNITKLGNAIVDLANKGVATGGFIVDFTQRLSGIAKTANISLSSIIGLAAGLEESGQKVESSATAISKLINTIAVNIPKAAQIAGVEVNKFTQLFATAPQEALLLFAQGLQKNKETFAEIASSFKDAGEEGARVISTLAILGQKTDFFRQKIDEAGIAIQKTDSINAAFALKNETFGATLDKLGKEFNKLVTSPAVVNFLQGAVNTVVNFIQVLRALPKFINDNKVALELLAAGIILLNRSYIASALSILKDSAAKVANLAITKATTLYTSLAAAAQKAYAVVMDLLAGNITIAAAAQKLFSASMASSLGPIGAVLVLAGSLIIALKAIFSRTHELSAEQKANLEVAKRVSDATTDQVTHINILVKTLENEKVSLDKKKKSYQELIDINPDFVKTLKLDADGHLSGKQAIDDYIKSLTAKAEAEAKYSLLVDKIKEKTEALNKVRALDKSFVGLTDEQIEKAAERTTKGISRIVSAGSFVPFPKDLAKQITDLSQVVNNLNNDVQKVKDGLTSTGQATDDALTTTANTGKKTIADLEAEIDQLDKAFKNIAVTDTKAIQENRKQRQLLQDQLDHLEGKQTTGDTQFANLKKEADKFYDDITHLKNLADTNDQSQVQAEINRVGLKYKELLDKAKEYFAEHALTKTKYDAIESNLEAAKKKEFEAIWQDFFQKEFVKQSEQEYNDSLQASQEYFDQLKIQTAKSYTEGKLTKQQYDEALKKIDQDAAQNQIVIAQDYSGTVKRATTDLVKFKKAAEQQITADQVAETTKRKEIADQELLAARQSAVLIAQAGVDKGTGSYSNLINAKKNLLTQQFLLDTQYLDKKSELYKEKEEQLQKDLDGIDGEGLKHRIEMIVKYAQLFKNTLSAVDQFVTAKENNQLAKDKAANDAKKDRYQKQLDAKLISQTVFNNKTAELDADTDKKQKEIQRQQAKRQKALNIFQSIIDTASAVAEALPNIPLSIAVGIAGAIQTALIAATPLPELGLGDWLRTGPKHKDSEKGTPVLIERDEAVMSAAAMTDPKKYSVSGTAAQITSALNWKNGGANWAGGAKIVQMSNWKTERPAYINPELPRMMSQGGIVKQLQPQQEKEYPSNQNLELLTQQVVKELQETKEEIKNMKTRLQAVVSIKEFREEEKKYDDSKKVSGLNQ